MLKVAKDTASGEIIAMTIYSSKMGGFKCVGGTVVTEPHELRELGKTALKHITREDTKLFEQFIWTECSGRIADMWEQAGGIKLPSAYLSLFMDDKMLESIELPDSDEDPYSYTKTINPNTAEEQRITKVIFGFPNKDVLEKYIKDKNMTLEELRKRSMRNPGAVTEAHVNYRNSPKEIQSDLIILMYFNDEFAKGRTELTEYEFEVITKSLMNIHDTMEPLWDIVMSKNEKNKVYSLMIRCMTCANYCSVLKVRELDEVMEHEFCRFPAHLYMPDAF